MKSFLPFIAIITFLGSAIPAISQAPHDSEIYKTLQSKDSLLFHAAFNSCDPDILQELFTEDFEFYHDRSGVAIGREVFIEPFRKQCGERIPGSPQPAKRILLKESLEVFPLYNQGTLYGAIQQGMHRFEFLNEQQQYQKGDIARFTHVWIKTGEDWKIKRELSFDHQPSDPSHQSSSN